MALTSKQAKFVASYQLTHNATESAINAGYPVKTAPQMGSKLVRNPKIVNQLEEWKAKKSLEVTKADFIDMALKDYKELGVTEPNKPRFLDIAGKALGHLGANGGDSRPNQTLNINISAGEGKSAGDLWDMTRKLLGE